MNSLGPICGLCGSSNIDVNKDIGCDIDPSGEERQHMNVCRECKAEQFWTERWHDFKDFEVHHGKWCPPDSNLFDLYFS